MKLPTEAQIAEISQELVQRQVLWNLEDAAHECDRSPKTLLNLISMHQLPLRRGWTTQRQTRRRKYTLSVRTVAILVGLTRLAPALTRPALHS
jgi:hypothetical protein